MLSVKEILELSNDMSVEIIGNVDNKHYTINKCGKKLDCKNCEYAEDIRNGEQR